MPKPSDDVQDLKRRLALLDRLDGRAIACADGVFLIPPGRVRDPRPLVAACAAGRPTSAAIRAALGGAAQPLAVDAVVLATAQRDLRAIASAPALRALAKEAPRIFRRYGEIDDAWIARKRDRIAGIADRLQEIEAGEGQGGEGEPPWFQRALSIVALIHGDDAAAVVRGAAARLRDGARARRAEARRALDEVIAAVEGEREAVSEAAIAAVSAVREAARLPGRSRGRRVSAAVAKLLDAPPGDDRGDHDPAPAARSIVDQIRAAGERILDRMPAPRGPVFREQAARFFAHYAVAFDPRPRDGRPLLMRPDQIERGLAKLRAALDTYGGEDLRLGEVMALLDMDLGKRAAAVGRMIARGLPLSAVAEMARLGQIEALTALSDDPEAAAAFAAWAAILVPHYRAIGIAAPISPALFSALKGTRRQDLAVLATCLVAHHDRAGAQGAEEAIARLDTTLGLFRRRPEEARSILSDLGGTAPGAGRAAFPDFAAWLGDDALLDQYVHRARLAGLPVTLSRSLTADFRRAEILAREEAYLAGLPDLTPAQASRRARLAAGAVERPDAAWTRRRLADRARDLLSRAYDARLDAVLRAVLQDGWGIALPRLTPGWRDAIRFYLAVDDNRELLGSVLRGAAAGADLDRALPANRAWITAAAQRFAVDAWLAPRSREVRLGGAAYQLAIERDPVEVLRMGVPFGTCLSLADGCNAASTVINAADANKRVIYLRDAGGRIVARKLIAVSEEDTLLGYRLYVAAPELSAGAAAAFRALCDDIAREAGLRLGDRGAPRQIHAGFWYDDGAVPFVDAVDADVEAYCRALGVPTPPLFDESLRDEARVFDALARGDEAAIRASLAGAWRVHGPAGRAAAWLVERLPQASRLAAARASSAVAVASVSRAARDGAAAMLEEAAATGEDTAAERAMELLDRFPRDAEVASALLTAASNRRRPPAADDFSLEHRTMDALPRYLIEVPVDAALGLCDRAHALWASVVEQTGGDCEDCRAHAEARAIEAIAAGYARRRDPDAVTRWLSAPRASALARRAALRIAARYALAADGPLPPLPPPALQRVRPCPEALRALARLQKRAPDLADDPDFYAALLRQSAGALPHGVALPVPRKSPFEALGDLLIQLDLSGRLAIWAGPRDPASSWDPGPWELCFHRRNPTPLRAALRAEAADVEARRRERLRARRPAKQAQKANDALTQLAYLGDVRAIAAIASAAGPSPNLAAAQDDAADVAAQVEVADGLGSFALPLRAVRRPRDRFGSIRGVDLGLVTSAFAVAARAIIEGAAVGAASLAAAFAVIAASGPPIHATRPLVERILARPVVSDQDRELVEAYLDAWRSRTFAEAPLDLFVAAARHDEIRPALAGAMAGCFGFHLGNGHAAFREAARRAGREDLADALLGPVVRALLKRGAYGTLSDVGDDDLFRRAAQITLDESPVSALLVYKATPSHAQAAVFLEQLRRSPDRATPAMRAAVAGLRSWGAHPQNAARYAWLLAVVKGKERESGDPQRNDAGLKACASQNT